MKYLKLVNLIIVGLVISNAALGQNYKVSGFSFDMGLGQLLNTGTTSIQKLNSGLNEDKIQLDDLPKEFSTMPINIEPEFSYHLGYFLKLDKIGNENRRSEWTVGLVFNNFKNAEWNQFDKFEDTFKSYSFQLKQNNSYMGISTEKLFYTKKTKYLPQIILGAGGSIGWAYSSRFDFIGIRNKWTNGEGISSIFQQIQLNSKSLFIGQEYLLLGLRFSGKKGNNIDMIVKPGFFQNFGKSPYKGVGYNVYGILRFGWVLR